MNVHQCIGVFAIAVLISVGLPFGIEFELQHLVKEFLFQTLYIIFHFECKED